MIERIAYGLLWIAFETVVNAAASELSAIAVVHALAWLAFSL